MIGYPPQFSTASAFSHDGKYLAACMENEKLTGGLQLWVVATGKLIVTLNNQNEFHSVVLSKDGRLLAGGS